MQRSRYAFGGSPPEPPCAAALKQALIDVDNLKGTAVADHQAATGNAAQTESWSSAATRAWADQYARMDLAIAALTKELLDLAAPQPGERVLDIGCGPGTTVLELARRVGPGGYVLGADVSKPSVARACERIATASLRHAEANVADASVHPFAPHSFELAFSRFGIMFFSDPVAAFENVRGAMRPGGEPCSSGAR